MSWLNNIKVDDLIEDAPVLQVYEDMPGFGFVADNAVKGMIFTGGYFVVNEEGRPPKKLENTENLPDIRVWETIKSEFREIICTDSDKYEKLRNELDAVAKGNRGKISYTIAACLASKFGFDVAAITGLVSVALYGLVKVTKEIYCTHAGAK